MANKIKVTKEEADKIHAKMICEYEKYIELCSRKKNLIKVKLETFHYNDPVQKIDDELALLNLSFDIEAKKNYVKYFQERKV